ncbi:MAG: DUF2169 domain-containing protein [Deltaproteobacteria bacterium]|nr:DUF2169 domain-containing protein [Deltaproteobacteria bacterium]
MPSSATPASSLPTAAFGLKLSERRVGVTFFCKQTLVLLPDASNPASYQEPLYHEEQRWEPRFPARIDRPADTGPARARIDVVVAPTRGRPSGPVRLAIGTIDKRATVSHRSGDAVASAVTVFAALPGAVDSSAPRAPEDQQLTELRNGEPLVLENLLPNVPSLATTIAVLEPRGYVTTADAAAAVVVLRPSTMCIDAERGTCTVTYRGEVEINATSAPSQGLLVLDGNDTGRIALTITPLESWTDLAERAPDSSTFTSRPGGPSSHPFDGSPEVTSSIDLAKLVGDAKAIPFDASSGAPKISRSPFVDLASLRAELDRTSRAPTDTPPPIAVSSEAAPVPSLAGAPRAIPIPTRSAPPSLPTGPLASLPLSTLLRAKIGPAGEAQRGEPDIALSVEDEDGEGSGESMPTEVHRRTIEFIWFDAKSHRKVRRTADWASLMPAPPPPPKVERGKPPPPPPSREEVEETQRVDVSSVLAKGTDAPLELEPASDSASDSGPPLQLVTGHVEFPFDEAELLKATLAAAKPLAVNDKRLRDHLDAANELLGSGLENAPEVVTTLVRDIREAWRAANRTLPADFLQTHTERVLLNQRSYQRRKLLDDDMLRAWLVADTLPDGIPVYLPASLDKKLPLFPRIPVRLILEIVPRQDVYETRHVAGHIVAMARLLTEPSKSKSKASP